MLGGLLALAPLFGGIMDIIKRVVPDKSTQDQLAHELAMYQLSSDFKNAMEQIEVNKIEAASESIFVAGWRPFIGWVCGIAFVYHVLLVPIVTFIAQAIGHPIPLPVFDHELLSNVLYGMLGLGGFRTAEKIYKEHNNYKLKRDIVAPVKKKVGLDATFNGE